MADINDAFVTQSDNGLEDVNLFTRIKYDDVNQSRESADSQRPLKYIAHDFKHAVANKELSYGISQRYSATPTELPQATSTNQRFIHELEGVYDEPRAYKGNGESISNTIDENSLLRPEIGRVAGACLTSASQDRFHFVDGSVVQNEQNIVPTAWVNGGASTRNELRQAMINQRKNKK